MVAVVSVDNGSSAGVWRQCGDVGRGHNGCKLTIVYTPSSTRRVIFTKIWLMLIPLWACVLNFKMTRRDFFDARKWFGKKDD